MLEKLAIHMQNNEFEPLPHIILEKAMAPHSSYSCLENPTDGGAWWAAVYGVAQSWTRLSDLAAAAAAAVCLFTQHSHF